MSSRARDPHHEHDPDFVRAVRDAFHELNDALEQLRDRAELKMHLGMMDAEVALDGMRPRIRQLSTKTRERGADAEHIARRVAHDIGAELERIGKRLEDIGEPPVAQSDEEE